MGLACCARWGCPKAANTNSRGGGGGGRQVPEKLRTDLQSVRREAAPFPVRLTSATGFL